MLIETNSTRLACVAHLCRLFPPAISGVFLRLYTAQRGARENVRFVARSSLADVTLGHEGADWVSMNFAIRGFYEWMNVAIANAVCRGGDTIVEVGANIGTESLLFARIVGETGRVISFEPLPANVKLLEANLARNALRNVRVVNAAVSDRAGTLRFEPPRKSENSGMGRVAANGSAADLIEVQAVVLDEMHAASELPAPRLVVIDVQGAELLVLNGARRLLAETKPYVIWEAEEELLRNFGASPPALAKLLTELGYRNWEISKWGLRGLRDTAAPQYNCLSIPPTGDIDPAAEAARISARLRRAALLPLVRGLNPAVIRRPCSQGDSGSRRRHA